MLMLMERRLCFSQSHMFKLFFLCFLNFQSFSSGSSYIDPPRHAMPSYAREDAAADDDEADVAECCCVY